MNSERIAKTSFDALNRKMLRYWDASTAALFVAVMCGIALKSTALVALSGAALCFNGGICFTMMLVCAEAYGPLHLWEFVEPLCWVRAATEAEARATLERENGKGDYTLQHQWPDEQPFSMRYEDDDAIPSGTEVDVKCSCDPKDLDEYGCECDAATPTVTMPAGWWANRQAEEWVIYVYEG